MQRQSELELALCKSSALYFPAVRQESRDKFAYREAESNPPSPTVSDDDYALRTAREIRRAMASDLLSISANSSQVSLLPFGPEGIRPVHVQRKSARQGHLNELNSFSSSMALSQYDQGDMEVDDGDTDSTSLAPSLSSLRSSVDLRDSRDTFPSRTISGPGPSLCRPSLPSVLTTRPARAQSCGSKRPPPSDPSDAPSGTRARASGCAGPVGAVCSGTGEEEKRRKVDEAMVLEEAVSTGVIMPDDRARNLGEAEAEMGLDDSMMSESDTGAMERMCASTPDLGSLRSRSAPNANAHAGQHRQRQAEQNEPFPAPGKMAFGAGAGAVGRGSLQGQGHSRGFTAPAAPGAPAGGAVFGHVVKTSDTHPIIISPFFPDELLPVLTRHLVLPTPTDMLIAGQPSLTGKKPLRLYSDIDVVATLLSHVSSVSTSPSPVNSASGGLNEQQHTARPASEVSVVRSPTPWSADSSFSSAQSQSQSQSQFRGSSMSGGLSKPQQLGNLLLSSCPGKRLRMDGPVKGRGPVCRDLKTDLERIKGEGVGCLVWYVSICSTLYGQRLARLRPTSCPSRP